MEGFWDWVRANATALQGLGAVAAACVAAMTLIISQLKKPAATNTDPSGAAFVQGPLLEKLVQRALNVEEPSTVEQTKKPARPRRTPEKIIADLQAIRSQLTPDPLTSKVFPPGLSVIRFVPGEVLKIRVPETQGIIASVGWFSFIHFAIFPGVFASFLFGGLLGEAAGVIGALAGLAWWWYLVQRGIVATIKLRSRTWSASGVLGGFFGAAVPNNPVLSREQKNGRWHTRLIFGGSQLWLHVSSNEDEGLALGEPFLDSLRAELGLPVEVAEGIFISPMRSQTV
jgi:hypothetical protein